MIPFIGILIDAAFIWFVISLLFKDHDLFFWMVFRWLIYAALAKIAAYFLFSKLTGDSFLASLLGAVAFLFVFGWLIWNYYGDRHASKTLIVIGSYVAFQILRVAAFTLLLS